MKKLFVVSKTHLDLGFTDYAKNIKNKYLTKFIPQAINLAESLNKDGKKNFVWTTGSWLIKEALESEDKVLSEKTAKALRDGNIAPHALAFTTHSELMDKDLVKYNLSIVDKIDKISGRKTIAAKMTDVPGHTKALVPILAEHGIKLLHIGINTAAPFPKVPECFVWKCDGKEIVVIYADGYGGEFKCPLIDEILYFDNAADNHGTDSSKKILNTIDRLQKKYPDYEVSAGRLDDIANQLWEVRDKLPVIEDEIGDSWIHGVATDPYKVACFRTLCKLKNKWLAEGSLSENSPEYIGFADNLICVCEHTWGMDCKMHFCDTENYSKQKFVKARKKDIVRNKRIFGDFPFRFLSFINNTFGPKHYRYSTIEKSWLEQREYITKAINCLPKNLKEEALSEIAKLLPSDIAKVEDAENYAVGSDINIDKFNLSVDKMGGITLSFGDQIILNGKDKPLITYRSYGAKDFDYYKKHYMRHTLQWAVSDNLNPGLKGHDKYPQGVFPYSIVKSTITKANETAKITAIFRCDDLASNLAGAPLNISCEYTLSKEGLHINLLWTDKDAVRSTESTAMHFYPVYDKLDYVKIGCNIDPEKVVYDGDRKLSVIEKAVFDNSDNTFEISSIECPLVASDGGNILHFDNGLADIKTNGLTYILHDNIWKTNFPLWYEDNAKFTFNISKK